MKERAMALAILVRVGKPARAVAVERAGVVINGSASVVLITAGVVINGGVSVVFTTSAQLRYLPASLAAEKGPLGYLRSKYSCLRSEVAMPYSAGPRALRTGGSQHRM